MAAFPDTPALKQTLSPALAKVTGVPPLPSNVLQVEPPSTEYCKDTARAEDAASMLTTAPASWACTYKPFQVNISQPLGILLTPVSCGRLVEHMNVPVDLTPETQLLVALVGFHAV